MSGETNREIIQRVFDERIAHDRRAVAEDPWCFALAELQANPDRAGVFLAEFMRDAAASEQPCGEFRIVIQDAQELMVATRGAPVSIDALLDVASRGGLAQTLAVSDNPEVYSALCDGARALAVRFDAGAARASIGSGLPTATDFGDALLALPPLRYPIWVDEIPASVQRLAAQGYDTVVRLPFAADRGLDHIDVELVIEQEPVLVGAFGRVSVQTDGHDAELSLVRRDRRRLADGLQCELADVVRGAARISAWRLYRLESDPDTVVGIRLGLGDPRVALEADDCFPPRVSSGLPFLLHTPKPISALGESEVGGLARLVVLAVGDCAASGEVDMGRLARLVLCTMDDTSADSPALLGEMLRGLDRVAWIPTAYGGLASPLGLLPTDRETAAALASAFSADHVKRKALVDVPDPSLGERVFEYIRACRPDPDGDFWDALDKVLRRDCRRLFGQSTAGLRRLRSTLSLIGTLARGFEQDGP